MDLTAALLNAVSSGDESSVSHCLALGASILAADFDGMTVLHIAAGSETAEKIIPYLLSKGANKDARDKYGRVPLHYLAYHGRQYGAACLLHQGGDPNMPDEIDGNTPLHLAVLNAKKDVARILLAYGAKTSSANFSGYTCRDYGIGDLGL